MRGVWHNGYSVAGIASTYARLATRAHERAYIASIHATHSGQFGPFAPTGKRLVYRGIEILRLADGQIAELWGYANILEWLCELGATVIMPE